MRVIVRFSLDGDLGSKLRNQLHGILSGSGLSPGANTATWEGKGLSEQDVHSAMCKFWDKIQTYSGPGSLDHFWMYVDDDSGKVVSAVSGPEGVEASFPPA